MVFDLSSCLSLVWHSLIGMSVPKSETIGRGLSLHFLFTIALPGLTWARSIGSSTADGDLLDTAWLNKGLTTEAADRRAGCEHRGGKVTSRETLDPEGSMALPLVWESPSDGCWFERAPNMVLVCYWIQPAGWCQSISTASIACPVCVERGSVAMETAGCHGSACSCCVKLRSWSDRREGQVRFYWTINWSQLTLSSTLSRGCLLKKKKKQKWKRNRPQGVWTLIKKH